MDREQMDEFGAVRQTACDALRFGALMDQHRPLAVCQFLILPSFENAVSWDVTKVASRKEGAHTRLYRSCWRMDIDSQAMSSPVERCKHSRPYRPTIEVDWVPIDEAQIDGLLKKLRLVPVPLAVASNHAGLDGTFFELTVGGFFCSARIVWWCSIPDEWRALQPVVSELERLFASTWETHRGKRPS